MLPRISIRLVALTLVSTWDLLVCSTLVRAERPSAPQLLPSDTVAYVRINDVQDMVEKFQETSIGRLTNDDQILPLLRGLYGSAAEAFSRVEDRVGNSLDELLTIPQGEMSIAMVAPDDRDIGVVVIMDVDGEDGKARELMQTLETEFLGQGRRTTEEVGEVEITIFTGLGDDNGTAAYFFREDSMLLSSDVQILRDMLSVWDGEAEDVRTLADNRKFTTIIKKSAGSKGERPQLTWYVDPVDIFRKSNRDNVSSQVALALLEPFGVTGFKAVGGSMIFAPEEFDSIQHMHVMMSSPRRGVLDMVAMESGDTTPEPWVPNDVATYMTMNWDFGRTMKALTNLYDRSRGDGAMETEAGNFFEERFGMDFQEDVVDQLAGRVTYLAKVEKPGTVNSQSQLVAVKLNDAEAFEDVLAGVADKFSERMTAEKLNRSTYYRMRFGRREPGALEASQDVLRQAIPCTMVVGDYLILSDSVELLKDIVRTKRAGKNSLADDLEFKLIRSKLGMQPGGDKPGMIMFQRPEESFRSLYEMATSDGIRQGLSQQAEGNDFMRAINDALTENPLPPFSEIAKYLAPSGGLFTMDETGLHYTGFALRRE